MKTVLTITMLFCIWSNQAKAMIYDYFPGEEVTLYQLGAILKIVGDIDKVYDANNKEFVRILNVREVFDNHPIAEGTDLEGFCQNIGYESDFNTKETFEKNAGLSLKLKKLPSETSGFFKLKFLKNHSKTVYQLTCWRKK